MKAPVLIVIFDFFVCSLLLSVSFQDSPGSGGNEIAVDEAAVFPITQEPPSEFSREAIEADFETRLAMIDDAEQAIANAEEAEREAAQQEAEREKSEAEAELVATEEELRRAQEYAKTAQQALDESEKEKRELAGDLAKLESQNKDLAEGKNSAEEKMQMTKDQLAEMTIALRRANTDAAKAEKEKEAQGKQLAALAARLVELEKMKSSGPSGSSSPGSNPTPGKTLGQSALQSARLEVKVGITEDDTGFRLRDDKFDRTFYPVTFQAGEETYFLASAENFALGWDGLSEGKPEQLIRFEFTLGSRGANASSWRFYGNLIPVSIEKNLIFSDIPDSLNSVTPLAFVGRERIGQGRVEEGNLYKTNRSGDPMSVKFALDLSNSRYVLLTSEPVTPREDKKAPKPELGDFIVTADQRLVAIMIDEKRGLIIDADLFNATEPPISLNTKASFMKAAIQWKEALKE